MSMRLIDKDALLAEYDRVHIGEAGKARKLIEDAPEVFPYTDDEVQKMQDMQSAEVEKAFELGREDVEQQWIPCSERLPEEDQICIVTDDTQRCAYEYGFHNDTYDEVNGWTYLGHKIIAWMPLPEPWRGANL